MDIGSFEIITARDGGFDVYDRSAFNNWEAPKGLGTFAEAETWAAWAHAYKTRRTFSGLCSWAARHGR